MIKYFFAVTLSFLAAQSFSWSAQWNLNDVSILMALPKGADNDEVNTLLTTTSKGTEGELFPKDLYQKIGVLSLPSDMDTQNYSRLRAVAFRFDSNT